MSYAILGPTLLDIADFTGSSMQMTSQLFTSRGAGATLGSAISGIIFDHFNYYLTFAIVLFFSAILNFLSPLVADYAAAMFLMLLAGVCLGFLDAG